MDLSYSASIPFSDPGRRISALLGLLWLLNLIDLLFTLWANRFIDFYEVNPIARILLHQGAIGPLVLYKVVLISIGSTIFWRTRRDVRAEVALWGVVLIYVALMIHWSHVAPRVVALAAN
jgi:hypothetical protein